MIMDLHEFFDYDRIVIESNQYQQVLPDTLKQETDMPVVSYQTESEKHFEDKEGPGVAESVREREIYDSLR